MKEKAVKLGIALLVFLLNISLALAILPNYITVNGSALVSLSPNIILWLKLNEGGGNKTFDSSLYGNNGTLYNLPVWSYDHYALDFDGVDDYVEISDSATLDFGTNDFSIEFWIKSANWTEQQDKRIIAHWTEQQDKRIIAHWMGSNAWSIHKEGSNAIRFNGPWTHISNANVLKNNQWQHIAYIANRSGVSTWYIDGVAQGTSDISGHSVTSIAPIYFTLGAYRIIGVQAFFNGTIDEVRVYNRTLIEQEIKESFQRGKGKCSGETGLLICMNFDEGSGNTAGDNSGNNNNGTVYGATWFFRNEAKVGNALKFDGTNDYVQVPNSYSLNITGSKLSFDAWVYPTTSKQQLILSKLTSSPYYGYEFQLSSNNKLQFYLGGTSQPLAWWGTQTVPLNGWTHVAATYDGSNVKVYINGTFKEQFAVTGNIGSSAGEPLRLGVWRDLGYRFNGIIDEPRIWNITLTSDQVQSLYQKGANG